jgi:hypothetical protein
LALLLTQLWWLAVDRAIGGGPLVWALAKRGTMTLGKPGIMREAAIACATWTTQGDFLHYRLVD